MCAPLAYTACATYLLRCCQQAQRAELTAELKALQARRDQLSSVVAATPQPAASKRALRRLQQASEQLQLVQTLQVRSRMLGWYGCCY